MNNHVEQMRVKVDLITLKEKTIFFDTCTFVVVYRLFVYNDMLQIDLHQVRCLGNEFNIVYHLSKEAITHIKETILEELI